VSQFTAPGSLAGGLLPNKSGISPTYRNGRQRRYASSFHANSSTIFVKPLLHNATAF
jgi:hypothetical protein